VKPSDKALPEYVARNRAAWDEWAPEYVPNGELSWRLGRGHEKWGVRDIPEREVRVRQREQFAHSSLTQSETP